MSRAICTVQRVCEENNNESAYNVKKLTICGAALTSVEDLSDCSSLEKVDLSKNCIGDASGLRKCVSISWLNMSHNVLTSMAFVSGLRRLTVLNLGYNNVSDTSFISNLRSLKALILNNNQITYVAGLEPLLHLNTLILSHNKLEEIEVGTLGSLVKLQLSHNALTSFPDVRFNMDLKNLLLNENRIQKIPEDYVADGSKLEIVEIGNNCFSKLRYIRALSTVKSLVRLNVLGNGFCDEPDFVTKIRSMFRNIKVLNSQPIHKIRQSMTHIDKALNESEKRKSPEPDGPSEYRKDTEKPSKKKKVQEEVSLSNKGISTTESEGSNVTVKTSLGVSTSEQGKKKHKTSKKSELDVSAAKKMKFQDQVIASNKDIFTTESEVSNVTTKNSLEVSTSDLGKKKHKRSKQSELDTEESFSSMHNEMVSASVVNVIASKLNKKMKKGVPALKDKNSGVIKVIEVSKSKRTATDSLDIDLCAPAIGAGIKDEW